MWIFLNQIGFSLNQWFFLLNINLEFWKINTKIKQKDLLLNQAGTQLNKDKQMEQLAFPDKFIAYFCQMKRQIFLNFQHKKAIKIQNFQHNRGNENYYFKDSFK